MTQRPSNLRDAASAVLAALAIALPSLLAPSCSAGRTSPAAPSAGTPSAGTPSAGGVPAGRVVPSAEHPWKVADPAVRLVNEGVALMEQYDYKGAVETFRKALEVAPALGEARRNLAVALFNRAGKEDLAEATAILDALLAEDPDDVRAGYVRAMIHQYSGEDDRVIELLDRVVKLAPDDPYAWYFLARSKSNLGQECRPELERAIALNPNLISAYFSLIRVHQLAGRKEEAAELRKTFQDLYQSPVADTVVSPEYRRMGPLSLALPLAAEPGSPVSSSEITAGAPIPLADAAPSRPFRGPAPDEASLATAALAWRPEVALAFADVDGDGNLDLATTAARDDGAGAGPRGVSLFLGRPGPRLEDATDRSGLRSAATVLSLAFGDFDNDGKVDLFLACAGPNRLFRGRGDGTFEDVTEAAGAAGPRAASASAIFLDADHDSDLDILVCDVAAAGVAGAPPGGAEAAAGAGAPDAPVANQLLNNDGDGTFSDIAEAAGLALPGARTVLAVPTWADADRDLDLVLFQDGSPARLFLNDRKGRYHEAPLAGGAVAGPRGGVAQDVSGDGRPDLLVLPGAGQRGALWIAEVTGRLERSAQMDGVLESLATWGEVAAARVVDLDLDGDLDLIAFSKGGHALLNDGRGRFALRPNVWPADVLGECLARELVDWDGDGTADLVRVTGGGAAGPGRVDVLPTILEPPARWIAVTPSGDRGVDKRTRSPASGFGTRIEVRAGLHAQTVTYTGLDGGPAQSHVPLVLGLDGAAAADYVALLWPDGVTQAELGLAAGARHRLVELERKIASCPVLFSWNGERFEFISDFAGVGGLGYYLGPEGYAPPQVLEHVKIEPRQLAARNGRLELRVTEPMEEVAYVDRLELLAVDHPETVSVWPDERLAVSGPQPSRRLLVTGERVFPRAALDDAGGDCTARILRVDREYAYRPPFDRRFHGFARRHALILDFGSRLDPLAAERGVHLFLNGWIEYPYSQTTYAAGQASVRWEPLRVDLRRPGGGWTTIVADAGAPGGIGRTIAVDLTGKLPAGPVELRLSTNLEISIDQAFVARDLGTDGVSVRSVPLLRADLRRLGFPLEHTPDGREPTIWSYEMVQASSPFKLPAGSYTRYGPVEELLRAFDDRHAILGSGDEIALEFDAEALPPPGPGGLRSFVLVSHAYCKDMDLYTAEPDTVEPLPFRAMTGYPPPAGEAYPETDELRRYRAEYNTRVRP